MQYDAQRGVCYLWETTLQFAQRVLLCVHMVCVWVGVRANLHCMHTFQTDHMFICVKLKEQCVPVAYL